MTMPAYKRKTKRGVLWRYSGSYMGVKYCSRSIYPTKQQAQKAETAERKKIESKQLNDEPTLLELINDRLDDLQAKRSEKYYDENRRYYKMLLDDFGDVNISKITKRDLSAFINKFALDLKKRKKTFEKANAMMRIFSALFAPTGHNPVKGITHYPIDKKLKYIPSNEEIEAVLLLCDKEQQDLVLMAMETGARITELLNLTYEDVYEDYIVLYTRKSKNSNLVGRKIQYRLNRKGKGRIFNRWNRPPKFLEKKIKKLNQKPWGFHNLRHRKASLMSKQGKPIFEIMAHLGHSNLSTTQKYLQLLP
jgi:integrase